MLQETRDKLAQTEARIRELREERARATKLFESAKAAYTEASEETKGGAAKVLSQAKDAVGLVETEIERQAEEQTNLLRHLGDAEAGRAGSAWPGVNGWIMAADGLDLSRGELRVDVPAAALLRPAAAPVPLPQTPSTSTVPSPVSNRWLYPTLPSAPFGALPGDLTATDFVVTFSDPLTGVTGVEIPPATSTEKAVLPLSAALATPTAKRFAVVAEAVPAKLFDTRDALRSFLSIEMARRLDEAYDDHVVSAIEAASPPSGSSGSDLVAKIRNAISETRVIGGEPTVIALSPSDAASLDLTQDAGGYVFNVGLPDGANGVWSLRVREAPSVSAPLLVSPSRLGLSYVGEGSVLADPYHRLKTNQVRVRVEAEAVFHIRNIAQGAYVIT